MRSPNLLEAATNWLRMKKHLSDDSAERTIAACAWLIDLAQYSVDHCGWDPVVVRWLERVGSATHEAKAAQEGGMGAVAPMATQRRH
jgi:hypothetical protein